MSEWQEARLGGLIDINQSSIGRNYEFENIRYYDISSIGTGVAENPKNLSRSEAPSRAKRIIKDGDTILATVRPGNRSFYCFKQARGNDIASTGFAVISPRNNLIDNKFLYYLVSAQSFTNYLVSNEQGATYPAITPSVINRAKINLPPLPTQQKIAKILSNYDDLIENNLKRIKLLEESARLTYEEWFLRFRIDGKKLDIDPATDLPFGWKKKTLGDCVNNFDNQRRPLSRLIREGRLGCYPYYGAASVLDHIDNFIFDGKYLLVGEDGTVQTKAGVPMLQFINCKFWVSNHAHILTGKNISTEFLYLVLNVYPISNHITGAAQPKINQQNLNRIPMVVANEDLRVSFDKIILPIFKQIFNLKDQNQLLKEARDILLPRLMTGMIDTDNMDIAV